MEAGKGNDPIKRAEWRKQSSHFGLWSPITPGSCLWITFWSICGKPGVSFDWWLSWLICPSVRAHLFSSSTHISYLFFPASSWHLAVGERNSTGRYTNTMTSTERSKEAGRWKQHLHNASSTTWKCVFWCLTDTHPKEKAHVVKLLSSFWYFKYYTFELDLYLEISQRSHFNSLQKRNNTWPQT